MAERCLGHTQRGIERVYNLHTYAGEKAAALQAWADHVEAVVSGQRGKVVTMRRKDPPES